MTALSAPRVATSQLGTLPMASYLEVPLQTGVTLYPGAMVGLDSSGYGIAGSTSALRIVGVYLDGTTVTTTGSAGATTVRVRQGAFKLANSSSTDAITIADVGRPCYLVDDQTVARTSSRGARPFAGIVAQVETDGVYVEITGQSADPTAVDVLIPASADLSTKQYYLVDLDSAAKVAVASAAGQRCVGVLQNTPSGDGAISIVRVAGISNVIASTTVAVGSTIATTSAGKSKVAVASTVAGGAGDPSNDALVGSYALGVALTVGATDTAHRVLLQPIGAIPTTAA